VNSFPLYIFFSRYNPIQLVLKIIQPIINICQAFNTVA
jgi:hypothetical protein